MQANDYPTQNNNNNNNNNNNQEQIFLSHFDQFSISFIYTGLVIRNIRGYKTLSKVTKSKSCWITKNYSGHTHVRKNIIC